MQILQYMVNIDYELVEQEIIKVIEEVNTVLEIKANIDKDSCPATIGIGSQILVTLMGRLESALEITIPNNCYIFYDKEIQKQLTIKEAAQKLIKISKNGNK